MNLRHRAVLSIAESTHHRYDIQAELTPWQSKCAFFFRTVWPVVEGTVGILTPADD
jgi:hypothetical protein